MSNPIIYNDRLPIDILVEIFGLYRINETPDIPLETLLLVCKSWNTAALSCGALWGMLRIFVSHEPVMKLWRSRLPLRLARSGPSTPLDIVIVVRFGRLMSRMMESPECLEESYHSPCSHCKCVGKRERFVQWTLDTLAGENGELCKRWRSLHIDLGTWLYRIDPHQSEEDGILLRGLTYPTPTLTKLQMNEQSFALTPPGSTYRILPYAPVLQELDIKKCNLPGLLPLQSVKKIRISNVNWSYSNTVWRPAKPPRIISLCDAISVESLSLVVAKAQNFQLGSVYPKLTHIELVGTRLPLNISNCIMPHLRHLSIDIGYSPMCRELVMSCPELLSQITTLEVWIHDSWQPSYPLEELRGTFLEILHIASVSLTSFRSIEVVISIVLKWLWESGHPSHSGNSQKKLEFKQNLIISKWNSDRELKGDESPADLEKLAQELPGITTPDQDWNTLITDLEIYVDRLSEC